MGLVLRIGYQQVTIRTDITLKVIGLRIQELRYARDETQESLAGKLQMLPPNYARIEQGRSNLTVDTLVRVANGLEVELS
ncbi:MAG TPA: helix-turn-helix transcriptional regulator, partial [Polyangiaceae bacterium]